MYPLKLVLLIFICCNIKQNTQATQFYKYQKWVFMANYFLKCQIKLNLSH